MDGAGGRARAGQAWKKFLAGGRINERRFRGQDRQAKGAHRATLLIFIRLRRMLTAVLRLHVLLHLGATARLDLRGLRLDRDGRKTKRTSDRQAEEKSQNRSHWEEQYGFVRDRQATSQSSRRRRAAPAADEKNLLRFTAELGVKALPNRVGLMGQCGCRPRRARSPYLIAKSRAIGSVFRVSTLVSSDDRVHEKPRKLPPLDCGRGIVTA